MKNKNIEQKCTTTNASYYKEAFFTEGEKLGNLQSSSLNGFTCIYENIPDSKTSIISVLLPPQKQTKNYGSFTCSIFFYWCCFLKVTLKIPALSIKVEERLWPGK